MRVCWISTLLLGLFHAALLPSSSGLEGGKKIGIDDVYKPRKWSQVRDGPYRMVVSSRDQESNETQLDSRKGTRSRQGTEEYKEEERETTKTEVVSDTLDQTKDAAGGAESESPNDKQESKLVSRPSKDTDVVAVVTKARIVDRRKQKAKFDQGESSALSSDNYENNEKSTQRAITKLARKRDRILSNENFRKAHRISVTDGHFSTVHPSTISHKLHNHFRPIDRGIPRESIIPFFDFGKKLSTGKPLNAINFIEGSSTPGAGAFEITTHKEDDDFFHEDMDVSVVKHKPVEWNSPPRARPPPKNHELTSYFRTNPGSNKNEQDATIQPTTILPDLEKEDMTTTQIPSHKSPPIEPSITIPTTMLPPEQPISDLQTNESKAKNNVTPSKQPALNTSSQNVQISTLNSHSLDLSKESNSTQSTQLPRSSQTAKILSTAVVTSVSVKETYKHPRLKTINSQVEEIVVIPHNLSIAQPQALKIPETLNSTEHFTSSVDTFTNQTHRVDKSLSAIIVPSTHRPPFERFLNNKTIIHFKSNTTIQPTTIRPKFRSNIEYHTFATKVPTSTTTHKPVNRSLYSTSQREHQKNKFISFQHHKPDNRSLSVNYTAESSLAKSDPKLPLNNNENKTKMYLTIRSRLPNQSATYRSTFRRNGTKPVPPVLRVIATPSSYIEVPRIISRLIQNSTSTTTTQKTTDTVIPQISETKDTIKESRIEPNLEFIQSSTEATLDTTFKSLVTPTTLKSENSPMISESTRGVRMNNHRMPLLETTTEQDLSVELTTEVVIHSLDTTAENPTITGPSPTEPVKLPSNEGVNIVTVGPRQSTTKPKLSWVYLGQKNRTRLTDSPSVEVAYWNGFGIAPYVLAAIGIIPLILGGFILLRQIFIKSKKKMLDESEYSSEYNRTPLPTKLPRITSHIVNWEGEKATSSLGTAQHSSNQTGSHHQSNQHQSSQHQSSHPQSSQHQSNHHQSGQHQNNHHQGNQHQNSHHQSSQHQNNQQSAQGQHQSNQHTSSLYLIAPGKWEFPRDKLRLQTLLGEGNFGQVWKAEADDISGHEGLTRLVAVKTVKEGSGGREREDLLRELAIMKELGSHPNVVTLLGCCTDREPFLLIMEYVMYGKMLTFLREHRTRAHYFNFSDLNSALVSRDLTVFAYCVARGMEFLVSKGIIHRDLAARNILVDHNKLCKIADFGMSRNVRDTGEIYEQRPNRGALPIRWMAPEALHCSVFTHKSDVWSFGILVWEIITLGCTPYQTMGAREVMRRVREGYRLERPIHCSQELYKVITRCWAADASKRPTFTDLKHDMASLLSDPQTNGACVDLDALTEEMSSHSC